LGNVETDLRGRTDFPVGLQRRDEHDSLAGVLRRAPGDDDLQVCARIAQSGQHLRKAAGPIFDGCRPNIHTFHEKIHDSSPSSRP
jgi:hypothetical protein